MVVVLKPGERWIHTRKKHQNRSAIPYSEVLNIRIRHSEDGRLSCTCEKRYNHVPSLHRHRTSCAEWILIQQPEFGIEQSLEGNIPTL